MIETKQCQNCKQNFLIEDEDFAFYKKIDVPPPTWCPECRLQRRLSFRNDRTLYKRTCGLCQKDIISIYHKDSPYTVYCSPCWWSDKWDPLDHAKNYDFSRPFFDQFDELMKSVPLMANFVVDEKTMVNSVYNNMVVGLKNCYLLSNADYNEDCLYGCEIDGSKSCVDTNLVNHCELCYDIVNCQDCFGVSFSVDCESCHDVLLSRDLVGCSYCFGCVGLRNKQYHIFNQPYSKEEYQKQLQSFDLRSQRQLQQYREKAHELWLRFPHKFMHERRNTNVSGDYIYNSENTQHSWIVREGEDIKYCQYLVTPTTKDSYDYTQYGGRAELFYEVLQGGNQSVLVKFSWFVLTGSREVEYSLQTMSSSNIFGSIGLRSKQYCIFNKQYSKEEYEQLRTKIREHMDTMPYEDSQKRVYRYGEFFPFDLSPFAYNETTAKEYFPLPKGEALRQGLKWRDPEERTHRITVSTEQIPDSIGDVSDTIVNEIFACAHKGTCNDNCTVAFKIIGPELKFYQAQKVPLPRLCPNCRHYQRLAQRNPLTFGHRKCACAGLQSANGIFKNTAQHFHGTDHCPNEFETSYAPDRKEIVYCEQCYNAEVA